MTTKLFIITMPKARTLAQVNKAIQKKHPLVELVKGEGYFYIYSSDKNMGRYIASLYTSSIYVYALNQQTVEQWVADVDRLLTKND
jgi:hypothetical protein